MNAKVLFIHAWTPLHAGTGQSIGAIDQAIAREASTAIPYLPGSSIKGVLRDMMNDDRETCKNIYGPDPDNGSERAGSLHFGDARLVCMPMRSLAGTFGYVTSPYLLQRLARDLLQTGIEVTLPEAPKTISDILVTPQSNLKLGNKVVFEDLDFNAAPSTELGSLAKQLGEHVFGSQGEQESFGKRLAVVHDDAMSYAMEHATEVRARIRLDDKTKTVVKGALWYEESLPAESILSALVVAAPPTEVKMSPAEIFDAVGETTQGLVQLGGKATVGRGQCSLRFVGGGK